MTPSPVLQPGNAFGAWACRYRSAGGQLSKIVEEHQRRADEVSLIDADSKLADATNQLLYDPQSGALTKRGKDAIYAQDGAQEAWRKTVNEVANGLPY